MKLSSHHKVLLGLGVGLAVFACMVFFLILPKVEELQTSADAIVQERIQSEIARLEQRNDAVTEQEFQRLTSTTKELDQYSVGENSILPFLTRMESAASSSGVVQSITKLQPPVGKGQTAQIDILLQGTYRNILNYLDNVEDLATYVTMQRLTWSSTGDGAEETLTIQAQLSWQ